MCQYKLKSADAEGSGLAMKPTKFMTNSMCVAKQLSKRCKTGTTVHRHVPLTCGRAEGAAKYTNELCRAICQGLIEQKDLDRSGLMCLGEIQNVTVQDLKEKGWEDKGHEEDTMATDDVSGEPLDPTLVKAARALEVKYVK